LLSANSVSSQQNLVNWYEFVGMHANFVSTYSTFLDSHKENKDFNQYPIVYEGHGSRKSTVDYLYSILSSMSKSEVDVYDKKLRINKESISYLIDFYKIMDMFKIKVDFCNIKDTQLVFSAMDLASYNDVYGIKKDLNLLYFDKVVNEVKERRINASYLDLGLLVTENKKHKVNIDMSCIGRYLTIVNLNLRRLPISSSQSLKLIPKGESVSCNLPLISAGTNEIKINGKLVTDKWIKVSFKNVKGWLFLGGLIKK